MPPRGFPQELTFLNYWHPERLAATRYAGHSLPEQSVTLSITHLAAETQGRWRRRGERSADCSVLVGTPLALEDVDQSWHQLRPFPAEWGGMQSITFPGFGYCFLKTRWEATMDASQCDFKSCKHQKICWILNTQWIKMGVTSNESFATPVLGLPFQRTGDQWQASDESCWPVRHYTVDPGILRPF